MPLNLKEPITYLITSGETTLQTIQSSEDFSRLLKLVEAATAAKVNLIQLREKNLHVRVLYELTVKAAAITRGSQTLLLVNDRADVATAAGADGVHLTTLSLETPVVRRAFGPKLLIGVSTHSLAEAEAACQAEADFVVFGPVFETASKRAYGEPLGLEPLGQVASAVAPFPVLALGGVTLDNTADCFRAGAVGIAAIRLFNNADNLADVVTAIREMFREPKSGR
ncbi:MAG: thiamine phosphate synthase [Pyrinomonadaceae bacterium]